MLVDQLVRFSWLILLIIASLIHPSFGILVVDEIRTKLEKVKVTATGHANDSAILVRGKFPRVLSESV